MREILFRGKSINSGEWVESMTICKGTIKRKKDNVYLELSEGMYVGVVPETVGQFTGLTDKNGKKIFEGDIYKTHFGSLYSVEFYSPYSLYSLCRPIGRIASYPFLESERGEVIGNIHDNPELLNQ